MLHNRKGGEEMTEVKKKVLSFLSGLLATFLKLYGSAAVDKSFVKHRNCFVIAKQLFYFFF